MKHFLVVFDRADGRLLRFENCGSSREAMHERYVAEKLHRDNASVEIVVLGAESEDAVRRTHARYFDAVPELAKRGMGMVYRQSSAASA